MVRGLSRLKATVSSSNANANNGLGTSPPKNHKNRSRNADSMSPTRDLGLALKVSILKVRLFWCPAGSFTPPLRCTSIYAEG